MSHDSHPAPAHGQHGHPGQHGHGHGHGHGQQGQVSSAGAEPDPRRWLALVLLCAAQFMLIVDITVVQVALPSIGAELGLDRAALTWVVTTYTLLFGGAMVLGGRLADAFGARRMLLVGITVFTLASLLCGLASSGGWLILGRGAQGIGAALLSPAALSTITRLFDGHERNRALGFWAAIGAGGAAVGVLLSGLLTAGPGWEWVFYINVPVGLLVVVGLPILVRADRPSEHGRGVDLPGAFLVTAATGLLIYGLVEAGDAGWTATSTLAAIGGSLVLYVGFGWIESRVAVPLVRPAMLAKRPVLSGSLVMLLATGLLLALFFLSSLYLQHVLRLDALETGLLFLPIALAITVGAHLGGQLVGRLGGRPVAAGAFVLTAVGAALLIGVSPTGNAYVEVLPGFLIAAFGIGPAFVTATSTTLANVSSHEAGVASGVINTWHELGGSIGIAVVSTVAAASLAPNAEGVEGFTSGFTLVAVVAGVAAVVSLVLLPTGKPVAMVGHGHGH